MTGNRLAGKSAVITGAASGIGHATAVAFAAEGANLLLNDINADRLSEVVDGLQATGHTGDISREDDAEAMLARCVQTYGRADIVVANAGIFLDEPIDKVSASDWDRVLAVNGRGTFLTCKYAIGAMLRQGGGSIVCVSSISGVAGQPGQAAYGPAKFVVSGLTRHLAVEWGPSGIRVNAVAPGTIATEGLRFVPEERQHELLGRHPLGRFGEPAEVARAIVFLASDEASFVTGAVLPVDGGYLAE